jgi:hypothetical protein
LKSIIATPAGSKTAEMMARKVRDDRVVARPAYVFISVK